MQTGTGNFVLLPVDVSNQRQNSDILALTLGARYGITAKTELYSRLTATADDVRTQGTETDSNTSQQLNDLVLGVNHQFSADNDTPALLGFAEISLAENTATDKSDFVHGKQDKLASQPIVA